MCGPRAGGRRNRGYECDVQLGAAEPAQRVGNGGAIQPRDNTLAVRQVRGPRQARDFFGQTPRSFDVRLSGALHSLASRTGTAQD